jgi:hypothetical protein
LLAENFSSTVTKDGLTFRFAALKDYPIEKIKDAAIQITRTRKYTKMPTVADFVAAIEGDQEHADEDRAELQAMKVISEIKRVGSYGNPKFDDPITASICKSVLRWNYLCQMPEADTSFFIRDFKAAYLASQREGKRELLAMDGGIDPRVKQLCVGIGK